MFTFEDKCGLSRRNHLNAECSFNEPSRNAKRAHAHPRRRSFRSYAQSYSVPLCKWNDNDRYSAGLGTKDQADLGRKQNSH